MENKNHIWRPVSEYTGGRVLATNGFDVLIGKINSEGDCKSEEDGNALLCGITGFVKIEEILPEPAESEDDRIRKAVVDAVMTLSDSPLKTKMLSWVEKQGEHANFRNKIQIGDKVTRNEDGVLVNLSQLNRIAKKDENQGEQTLANSAQTCKGGQKSVDDKLPEFKDKLCELFQGFGGYNKELRAVANEQKQDKILCNPDTCVYVEKYRDIQQQAWSKEDEAIWAQISELLWEGYKLSASKFSWDDIRNWVKPKLKSLKERCTWKPSEKQISALEWQMNNTYQGSWQYEASKELLEQLKKLRGE